MRKMDIGTAVGLQVTAVGIGMGAVIASAHAAGINAMREDREAREQDAYDAAIRAALGNGEALGRIARQAVRDLASAHAEIATLRRALAQRQGYIDRMRAAA